MCLDLTTIVVLAVCAGVAFWLYDRRLRGDLRRAAQVLGERTKNREGWWRTRLRSVYVDHATERERQRKIVEDESAFIKRFVGSMETQTTLIGKATRRARQTGTDGCSQRRDLLSRFRRRAS